MESYTTVYWVKYTVIWRVIQQYTQQVHESILSFTNLIHILHCVTKHKDRRSQSSSKRLQQLFLSREENDYFDTVKRETFANWWKVRYLLLAGAAKRHHTPKFHRENFPQKLKICKSFLPWKFPAILHPCRTAWAHKKLYRYCFWRWKTYMYATEYSWFSIQDYIPHIYNCIIITSSWSASYPCGLGMRLITISWKLLTTSQNRTGEAGKAGT